MGSDTDIRKRHLVRRGRGLDSFVRLLVREFSPDLFTHMEYFVLCRLRKKRAVYDKIDCI